jgi:hypothetical protein
MMPCHVGSFSSVKTAPSGVSRTMSDCSATRMVIARAMNSTEPTMSFRSALRRLRRIAARNTSGQMK